jgi:hypothetical protein
MATDTLAPPASAARPISACASPACLPVATSLVALGHALGAGFGWRGVLVLGLTSSAAVALLVGLLADLDDWPESDMPDVG